MTRSIRTTLAALTFAALACTTTPQPHGETQTSTPTSTPDEQPPAPDCGPAIAGSEPLMQAGLVMLGEMHGSNEIPAFVGGLACHAAVRGLEVHVGLELPLAELEALERFLAGERSDATMLLQGEFWQRAEQDGRSSAAMLALLERIRVLKRAGVDVDAFAFDRAPQATWNERDAAMAAEILARVEAEPDALVITLSGNLHSRATTGLPWDPAAVPMAQHVRAARPDARTLDLRHRGGEVWACWMDEERMQCGPMQTRSPEPGSELGAPAIELWPARGEYEYDGVYVLDHLSASPPARGE